MVTTNRLKEKLEEMVITRISDATLNGRGGARRSVWVSGVLVLAPDQGVRGSVMVY